MLQIASNEGYITIDWSKITKKANKIADKAEEAITGEGPSFAQKVRVSVPLYGFDLTTTCFRSKITSRKTLTQQRRLSADSSLESLSRKASKCLSHLQFCLPVLKIE